MIEHSFCHLPGIGPASEQTLWQQGVFCWEDALKKFSGPGKRHRAIRKGLEASVSRLAQGDAAYFSALLPRNQQYRLFGTFRKTTAFLDIETTGLSPWDEITTIALWDGAAVKTYVRGENLGTFARDIRDYGLLVTYNGKTFDLPFIRSKMGLPMAHAHVDLRYVLGNLGVKGGLKQCEKAFGIGRGDLDGVDGSAAVILWHEYRKHLDPRALNTLLAYNVEDVINLEILMVRAYNRNLLSAGFNSPLPEPGPAHNPFSPDPALLARIGRRCPYG